MGLSNEVKLDFHVALPFEQLAETETDNPLKKPSENDSTVSAGHRVKSPDEPILWAEFKKGSEKAFTTIYNQYIVSLYHYGEMITSDKELIEDSIHDFFIDLWKNRENLAQVHSIKFYLYKGLK